MQLFVGLGNPDPEYARNRHNVGFMAVEAIRRHHDFPDWRRKFQGVAAEGQIDGEQVTLLLPGTYMNESGRSVREAAHNRCALSDIVVFHDEVQQPPAKLRVKQGGGNAGHKGLRSISALVGNDYRRVQIGVGKPAEKGGLDRYVLSDFDRSEWPWIQTLMIAIANNSPLLTKRLDTTFEEKIQLLMDAEGFCKKDSPKDVLQRRQMNQMSKKE